MMRVLLRCVLVVGSAAFSVLGQGGAIPAEVRLGARVETLRRAWPVASMVVVADSPEAYLAGIAAWSPERRFPVLLDDGTHAAREDIARFVRAFAPERVRLLSHDAEWKTTREGVEYAVASAWGADDVPALREMWRAGGFVPPGLVVADESDPAWTAAAALAAGRGQTIVWTKAPPGRIGSRMDGPSLRLLRDAIEAHTRESGWSWDALGDDLEAVTLCMNVPTKVGDDEVLALTDVVGRGADGERWAYAGAIVGTASEAAYRAMCALFLQPSSAWLFDGYTGEGGFAAYDMAPAADLLEEHGMTLARAGRTPSGSLEWGNETVGGIDAGLVMVNSSGTRRRFSLAPGRAFGVDIPMLRTPATVYFIHSFSAQNLDDRSSIARAWLDQGAYFYVGSVDEPYLRAFVPPGLLARRLLAPAPMGAAVRVNAPQWKINVLGDPLLTLGPDAPVFAEAVDFEGLRSAEQELALAVQAADFDRAGRLLSMLGRDEDLMSLTWAVLEDDAAHVGTGLAGCAAMAAIRAKDVNFLMRLLTAMDRDLRQDPRFTNPLWGVVGPELATTDDPRVVQLAANSVRRARYAEDATLSARAMARTSGNEVASALLVRLIESAPDQKSRKELMDELGRY